KSDFAPAYSSFRYIAFNEFNRFEKAWLGRVARRRRFGEIRLSLVDEQNVVGHEVPVSALKKSLEAAVQEEIVGIENGNERSPGICDGMIARGRRSPVGLKSEHAQAAAPIIGCGCGLVGPVA